MTSTAQTAPRVGGGAEALTYRQARDRVWAEFDEMPCMRLTAAQVQRLCGVEDARVCRRVLDDLVAAGFLRVGPDGRYLRRGDPAPRWRRPRAHAAPMATCVR